MKVVYEGGHTGVVLPDGTVCENGKPVEVDEALGKALLRQDFVTAIEAPAKAVKENK